MAATEGTNRPLRAALTAACGALGIAGATARATEVQSGAMIYTEPGRVSAFEAMADGRQEFADGRTGTFRFVIDALTGSSANGAVPTAKAQTFTSPSGSAGYTTPAGETPLDDTFSDLRFAASGGLTFPWGRLTSATVGLYASFERDYTSLGANAALSRDFNRKNTTLTVHASRFADSINPMGGVPVGLSQMPAPTHRPDLKDDDGGGGNGDNKSVTDLGVGLTQVLTRRTLLSLNYTNSRLSGYQSDPYKLVSVVDANGDPVPLSATLDEYLYEKRPDRRHKNAAAAELIQNLGRDVLTLSYRYFDDDWGITSNTGEVAYRLNFAPDRYLQPNFRQYHQSAADFYRRFLVQGAAAPEFASADYRLGDLSAVSYGLKYGTKLQSGNDLTVRLEYYRQTGEHHPDTAVGHLRDYDLFPTVDAWIVNVGLSFGN